AGSVTPMLDADISGGQPLNNGGVTPEDIDRTARLGPSPQRTTVGGTQGVPAKGTSAQYAVGRADFSHPALVRQPVYGVAAAYHTPPVPQAKSKEPDDLHKPSLVFVRSPENSPAGAAVQRPGMLEQNQILSGLSPGTRFVARLESAVSTAVKEPVVA